MSNKNRHIVSEQPPLTLTGLRCFEEPDLRNFLACLDIWSDQTLLDMKTLLDRAIAERGIGGTV